MQEAHTEAEHVREESADPNAPHREAPQRIIVGVGAVVVLCVIGLMLWFMIRG